MSSYLLGWRLHQNQTSRGRWNTLKSTGLEGDQLIKPPYPMINKPLSLTCGQSKHSQKGPKAIYIAFARSIMKNLPCDHHRSQNVRVLNVIYGETAKCHAAKYHSV